MDEIPDEVALDNIDIECDWCGPGRAARWIRLIDAFLCRVCFWQAPLLVKGLPWSAALAPPTDEPDPWTEG